MKDLSYGEIFSRIYEESGVFDDCWEENEISYKGAYYNGGRYWRRIPCAGNYWVSNLGEIYNVEGGNFLEYKSCARGGYLQVQLPFDEDDVVDDETGEVIRYRNTEYRSVYVAQIVAAAFRCNLFNKSQAHHIDEFQKTNNNVTNIIWTTSKENCNLGTRTARAAATLKQRIAEKKKKSENNE